MKCCKGASVICLALTCSTTGVAEDKPEGKHSTAPKKHLEALGVADVEQQRKKDEEEYLANKPKESASELSAHILRDDDNPGIGKHKEETLAGAYPPDVEALYLADLRNKTKIEWEQRCRACGTVVETVLHIITSNTHLKTLIAEAGHNFCKNLSDADKESGYKKICEDLAKKLGPELFDNFLHRWSVEKLCGLFLHCPTYKLIKDRSPEALTEFEAQKLLFEGMENTSTNDSVIITVESEKFTINDIKCDGCRLVMNSIKRNKLLPGILGPILKAICFPVLTLSIVAAAFVPLCFTIPYIIKPLIPDSVSRAFPFHRVCDFYRHCSEKNLQTYFNETTAIWLDKKGVCAFAEITHLLPALKLSIEDCRSALWTKMADVGADVLTGVVDTYATCNVAGYCNQAGVGAQAWMKEEPPKVHDHLSRSDDVCAACKVVVQFASNQFRKPRIQQRTHEELLDLCEKPMFGKVDESKMKKKDNITDKCSYLVNKYGELAVAELGKSLDDERHICDAKMGICESNRFHGRPSTWLKAKDVNSLMAGETALLKVLVNIREDAPPEKADCDVVIIDKTAAKGGSSKFGIIPSLGRAFNHTFYVMHVEKDSVAGRLLAKKAISIETGYRIDAIWLEKDKIRKKLLDKVDGWKFIQYRKHHEVENWLGSSRIGHALEFAKRQKVLKLLVERSKHPLAPTCPVPTSDAKAKQT